MYHPAESMTDEDSENRARRNSDAPVDLSAERETFVRQFLRKGVELTETLLEENKKLHEQLAELQGQNAGLRAQIASDDAIRDLIRRIDSLEKEREKLLDRSTELEATRRESEVRNDQIEQELHDLANLYVASHHLHSTLSVRGVVHRLTELLQQLVGAEMCAIYLIEPGGESARPVGADGVELADVAPIKVGEGLIGEVMMTGVPRIKEDLTASEDATLEDPLAIIPLMVREQAVGAIAVARVFEQKDVWAAVDHELFKLLGAHAGNALIAATLFAGCEGALEALADLESYLKPSNP